MTPMCRIFVFLCVLGYVSLGKAFSLSRNSVSNGKRGMYMANFGEAMASTDPEALLSAGKVWVENTVVAAQNLVPSDLEIGGKNVATLVAEVGNYVHSLPPDKVASGAGTLGFGGVLLTNSLLGGSKPSPSSLYQSDEPYPSGTYNPVDAEIYFESRWGTVLARQMEIGARAALFGMGILGDIARGKLKDPAQERMRAEQLTELLTSLGPTFIKVGQSLSIRTDLLRPAYANELATLQDRVPSFPTDVAREIVRRELNVERVEEVFATGLEPSASVVAAASLGQVYRATLTTDGSEVAVKVQRPDILEQVALDMHILRQAAPAIKRVLNAQTNLTGVVDDWGIGFVDELDYRKEASNAELFQDSIAKTDLRGVVFSPLVLRSATTRRVLTTEWVDGERLEKAEASDVSRLCAVAMNTYLTMMLDTGVLHSDPHPGNLLRTPAGRLCILDWGLVTRIDDDLQATFIEHIAHLTSGDYAKVPRDLVNLGFVPPDKADFIKEAGVVDVLTSVYSQWAQGGGAAKIDVASVFSELQGLSATYGNLFQLPPYFAYIARSFGVLEGIGLSNDPNYAILSECLPYISKRLLSDTSPRAGGALETFIYGASKDDSLRVIDVNRLDMLVDGFGNYDSTTALDTKGVVVDSAELAAETLPSATLESAAETLVELILAAPVASEVSGPTPLQAIFLEEMAQLLIASSRRLWRNARGASGVLPSGRSVLGTLVDPLGVFSSSTLINLDDHDERVLQAATSLASLLARSSELQQASGPLTALTQGGSPRDNVRVARAVLGKLISRRREVNVFSTRLVATIARQLSARLELGRPREGAVGVQKGDTSSHISGGGGGDVPHVEASRRLARARELLYGDSMDSLSNGIDVDL